MLLWILRVATQTIDPFWLFNILISITIGYFHNSCWYNLCLSKLLRFLFALNPLDRVFQFLNFLVRFFPRGKVGFQTQNHGSCSILDRTFAPLKFSPKYGLSWHKQIYFSQDSKATLYMLPACCLRERLKFLVVWRAEFQLLTLIGMCSSLSITSSQGLETTLFFCSCSCSSVVVFKSPFELCIGLICNL